jgi:hypothetical protein
LFSDAMANLTLSGWNARYREATETRAAGAGKGDDMSTDQMLWMILQDRRRQAADAARERLARTVPREREATDPTGDGVRPATANRKTFRRAEGAPGR